jgi:hypothetical protein
VLAVSPSVWQQVVTGGDHPANAIYNLAFALAVATHVPRPDVARWKKLLLAGLLGVGLSSRANFLFLLPPVVSQVAQGAGWRTALRYGAVTCAAFATVTLPFWLYDPGGFTPLAVQSGKLAAAPPWLPFPRLVIPAATCAVALALAAQRPDNGQVILLRNCALVEAIPVVLLLILSSVAAGRPNLLAAGYGLFSTFFGALAASAVLVPPGPERA